MTLYRSNDLLAGPAFEVTLSHNFVLGMSWDRATAAWHTGHVALLLGPLMLLWCWPLKEAKPQ